MSVSVCPVCALLLAALLLGWIEPAWAVVVDCTQTNAVGNVVSSSVPSADIYCYPCGAPDRIPPVGTVYGTGTYSGNSAICVAAAHSGKYKYGGPVKIYYSAYTGPFRGSTFEADGGKVKVTSLDLNRYSGGAFTFDPAAVVQPAPQYCTSGECSVWSSRTVRIDGVNRSARLILDDRAGTCMQTEEMRRPCVVIDLGTELQVKGKRVEGKQVGKIVLLNRTTSDPLFSNLNTVEFKLWPAAAANGGTAPAYRDLSGDFRTCAAKTGTTKRKRLFDCGDKPYPVRYISMCNASSSPTSMAPCGVQVWGPGPLPK